MAQRPAANRSGSVELLYNPYQVAFLHALDQQTPSGRWAFARISLLSGRRGGKTKIGGVGAAKKATTRPSTGWVCAPTYPDLYDFVMPAFFEAIPEGLIRDYSAEYKTLTLQVPEHDTPSTVAFRSLDDPNRARGPGLDWVWIDEVRKIAELAWDTMLPALTDKRGQAILTSSPNGFDWVYRRFWLPATQGEPGFWACKYKTSENPFIDRAELDRARRELDPLFYRQEFEADFVTFEGAVYGEAVTPQIVRAGDRARLQALIPEWPHVNPERSVLVGLDPGADHPFAAVVVAITEQGLVVVGEYLQRNKPITEHVRGLRALLHARNPASPLQPAQWAIDRSAKQWAIELAQHGILATAAQNHVVTGIQRVQTWLRTRQLWLPEDTCPRLIEQLQNYRWDDSVARDGQVLREQVKKIDDDLPDALRYALMLWPSLPEPELASAERARLASLSPELAWQVARVRRTERIERGLEDEDEIADLPADDLLDEPLENPLGTFYG